MKTYFMGSQVCKMAALLDLSNCISIFKSWSVQVLCHCKYISTFDMIQECFFCPRNFFKFLGKLFKKWLEIL